ncbi:MAG: hypothetical protein ABIL49_05835 [candidate division WOR-3 bacterium]|jgi:hypothetical protein
MNDIAKKKHLKILYLKIMLRIKEMEKEIEVKFKEIEARITKFILVVFVVQTIIIALTYLGTLFAVLQVINK